MATTAVLDTQEGSFQLYFGWSSVGEVILQADEVVDGVLADLAEHWVVENREDVVVVLVDQLGATSEQADQTADSVWEDGSAWARDQYEAGVGGYRRRRLWPRRLGR